MDPGPGHPFSDDRASLLLHTPHPVLSGWPHHTLRPNVDAPLRKTVNATLGHI